MSEQFFNMLESVPRLKHLWNKETKEINVTIFESELGVMSSGECHMAKFFAAVWFHDNTKYGFDLVDAVASIDKEHGALIMSWIADPFWP